MSEKGPLSELSPEAFQAPSEVARAPIHSRALFMPSSSGAVAALVVWQLATDERTFFKQLRERIEATLLSELVTPQAEEVAPLRGLVVLCFDAEANGVLSEAAPLLGLSIVDSLPELPELMANVRHEATLVDLPEPAEPSCIMHAALNAEEPLQFSATASEPFGKRPGELFAHAAKSLGLEQGAPIDALRALERTPNGDAIAKIRWMSPPRFRALCDGAGVVASVDLGRETSWSLSEPDESGYVPPPLLRVRERKEFTHVPVGLELLRWCVMPRQAGEDVPPFADWVVDAFTSRFG